MTKVLECNNIFDGCEGVVRADTQEELMPLVAEHAKSVHGVMEIDTATAELVTAAIQDE